MPVELEGVAAYGMGAGWLGRRNKHWEHGGWFGFGLAGFAAGVVAFLVAGGAGAGFAEPGKGPSAAVAVLPVNLEAFAFREQDADLFWSNGDAGERTVFFRLAGDVVFFDETNAFVAHEYRLQVTDYR